METSTEIYFYGLRDQFNYMSNFYKCNFQATINGELLQFNCSEQYFMYKKCLQFDPTNTDLLKQILTTTSATRVKALGRTVRNFSEIEWAAVRYNIMLEALYHKFTQNLALKTKLASTHPKILYEASKRDRIWGIGFYANDAINQPKERFGSNLLGRALMETRDNLPR
jgi:ribA/ribD-fused uncharacterized protein